MTTKEIIITKYYVSINIKNGVKKNKNQDSPIKRYKTLKKIFVKITTVTI